MVRKVLTLFATRAVCLGLFALAISRVAWLSDDSLITLRTVLNISHGWSFGFNALENVQGYTHPLWMLTWLGIGTITGSWAPSILALSVILSTLALLNVMLCTRSYEITILVTVLAITANSIVEYSTSGLENPMSFFLATSIFFITQKAETSEKRLLLLGLLTALLLLTRLDLVILIAPPIIYWFASNPGNPSRRLLLFSAGLFPALIAWYSFSLSVYGTLLPNTFLAKRNLEIAATSLIEQGAFYVLFSMKYDLMTALIFGISLVVPVILRLRALSTWSLGLLLYTLYVVQNGGDFMSSRFLSVQTIVGLSITTCSLNQWWKNRDQSSWTWILVPTMITMFVVSASVLHTPTSIRPNLSEQQWDFNDGDARGIADERSFYTARGLSLWTWRKDPSIYESFVTIGLVERESDLWQNAPRNFTRPETVEASCGMLGSAGILNGPLHHAIDRCALTDRYLANKPFEPGDSPWRIGHFQRDLPEGYELAILNSDPSFMVDPQEEEDLRNLWSEIRKQP